MKALSFLCNYHNYNDDILPGISYFKDKEFFYYKRRSKTYVNLSHWISRYLKQGMRLMNCLVRVPC
jgi:hypothetical protein